MIEKANLAGKSFITSSKIFESMEISPNPSRAEASDVSNAILDGTSCVMLASKTANGNNLFESLNRLVNLCLEVESMMDFKMIHHHENSIE